MSNEAFDGLVLSEKLSKLNNTQHSIESLSKWCISHRKKAKQIVETWDKLFNSAQIEQCISFLNLANDILQVSRRKGNEFVNEFWKVLPSSLKHVYGTGGEDVKKAVMRLVGIWEERKVFGSRGQSLKDDLLGKDLPSVLLSNGKSSNSIKVLKKDSQSVRVKLFIGGLPEKIVTAFQPVYDEHLNEETVLNKCNAAISHVGRIEEDLEHNSTPGQQLGSAMLDELREQENVLQQCVGQLESAEMSRDALVSQLKEALQDQESKLEHLRNQLQVARRRIEQVSNIRMRLAPASFPAPLTNASNPSAEVTRVLDQILPSVQPSSISPQPPHAQPVVSFASLKTGEEENKRSAAAAVAAKLAASASSAQMLTSVLSSLVAEEAASKNGGLTSAGFTTGLPPFPPEKRAKHDNPMAVSEVGNSDMSSSAYYTPLQQQQMTNGSLPSSTAMQPMSQANQMQAQFAPPPPQQATISPGNQFVQSGGLMMGMMPYGYAANTLPPPPPLPPHIAMGFTRPTQPPQQPQPQPQPQSQSPQQPQPATGGYYRPPGIGFYGQSQQSTTPPVPRQ